MEGPKYLLKTRCFGSLPVFLEGEDVLLGGEGQVDFLVGFLEEGEKGFYRVFYGNDRSIFSRGLCLNCGFFADFAQIWESICHLQMFVSIETKVMLSRLLKYGF